MTWAYSFIGPRVLTGGGFDIKQIPVLHEVLSPLSCRITNSTATSFFRRAKGKIEVSVNDSILQIHEVCLKSYRIPVCFFSPALTRE